jgi:hypothetical protein
MFSIDFHQFDHNFCESTIYSSNPHPEYLNAVSSLFISFIGINALRKPHLNIIVSMMYSCLAVNGVLSYLYHYYNSIGYGLLDRMSMVLLGLNTTYVFFMTIKKRKLLHLSFCINTMMHITIIAYYSFLLTIAGLHQEILFNILFGLFLVSIIGYVYIISSLTKIDPEVLKIGWRGVKYIVYSGIFWLATEGLCNQVFFIKYLFGHVWWHIFVSYGGYLVSIIPNYLFLTQIKKDYQEIDIKYDIFRLPYLDTVDYSENI